MQDQLLQGKCHHCPLLSFPGLPFPFLPFPVFLNSAPSVFSHRNMTHRNAQGSFWCPVFCPVSRPWDRNRVCPVFAVWHRAHRSCRGCAQAVTAQPAQLCGDNHTQLAALGGCCFFWHFVPVSTSEKHFNSSWKNFGQGFVDFVEQGERSGSDKVWVASPLPLGLEDLGLC